MAAKTDTNPFPPVELDFTLYDMLKGEQIDGDTSIETLCKLKPNSDHKYGKAVPLSDKYIIHSAQVDDADSLAHLQLEICSYLLMFFAGPMNVVLMASEGFTEDPTLTKEVVHKNAVKSYSVIQESQRPKVTTFANTEDYLKNHDGTKIRWGFAMDFADQLPYQIPPETVYLLNSKRWLGVNETMKSANDVILDCQIKCTDHQLTAKHNSQEWYYGGSDCHACTAGVEAEIQRVRDYIKKRQVPFVVKLTQSLSAVGTMLVQTDEEKDDLIKTLTEYLSTYLPRITKENAHLYTTSLIVSDFLPGETMALNFFIKRDGSPIYLGACHQQSTGESGRQATAITYADQEKLEPKYKKALEKIGKALQGEGYYGPAGADIMEDKDGNLNTIDLNVRTPLSLVLYLLRRHFYENRGFGTALVYECLQLTISREELEEKFKKEFEEGRLVLLGSTRFGTQKRWAFGVVIAGKSEEEIKKLSDRILEDEA